MVIKRIRQHLRRVPHSRKRTLVKSHLKRQWKAGPRSSRSFKLDMQRSSKIERARKRKYG